MSQFVETPTRKFTAGAAIARHLRVTLTAGKLAAAGNTTVELGTLVDASFADLDVRAVRLRNAQGTCKMVAVDAITLGNPVYAAASGKISASGSVLIGKALEASTADNDIIEILRIGEASSASASGGTTAAAFLVDNDATTPKIELAAQTGGTGDFKATIKPPATLTVDRVFTLAGDADATLANIAGAQTFTGKTLTAPVVNSAVQAITAEVLAAAGNAQGNAGAVLSGSLALIHATGADGTKGIVLPTAVAGKIFFIKNADAANAILKVYPASGDAINALAGDAAISMAAKTAAVFVAIDATTWFTFSLLPS